MIIKEKSEMRQTHTFILKILLDGEDAPFVRGQISEPASTDEWRATFADVNELFRQLAERLAAAPGELEIELALRRMESDTRSLE